MLLLLVVRMWRGGSNKEIENRNASLANELLAMAERDKMLMIDREATPKSETWHDSSQGERKLSIFQSQSSNIVPL